MPKISILTAPHYQWGTSCDGWHLLKTPALNIIEERMPPNTAEQRHYHQHSHQFFYVLDGELTMELEGEHIILRASEGLEISPGQSHQALNQSQADTRFLVTSQPPSHGDRIEA